MKERKLNLKDPLFLEKMNQITFVLNLCHKLPTETLQPRRKSQTGVPPQTVPFLAMWRWQAACVSLILREPGVTEPRITVLPRWNRKASPHRSTDAARWLLSSGRTLCPERPGDRCCPAVPGPPHQELSQHSRREQLLSQPSCGRTLQMNRERQVSSTQWKLRAAFRHLAGCQFRPTLRWNVDTLVLRIICSFQLSLSSNLGKTKKKRLIANFCFHCSKLKKLLI